MGKRWSETDVRLLRAAVRVSCLSRKEVVARLARRLGRTVISVHDAIKRFGLARPRAPQLMCSNCGRMKHTLRGCNQWPGQRCEACRGR